MRIWSCTKACANVLSSSKVYCRQIKSSLDSMISTLGSINQSLTMILGASDEEAPDEPPSKRPRTSDPPTRDELYLEPVKVLYFWWLNPPKQGQNSNQNKGPHLGSRYIIIYVASWFLESGSELRSWGFHNRSERSFASSLIKGN